MKKRILLFVISILFAGCVHHAVPSSKKPDCKTQLVGAYYFNDQWKGKAPALVLKKSSNELLFGKIIEINQKGCIFDPEKTRRGDIDAGLYEYEDIACIVDSNKQIIFGKIPKKWGFNYHLSFYLISIDGKSNDVIIESIAPNEKFSYCIPSGKYNIGNITFIMDNNTGWTDYTFDFSNMIFDFIEDSSIYIGDITLDSIIKDSEVIPFRVNEGIRSFDNSPYIDISLIAYLSKEENYLEHIFYLVDNRKDYGNVKVNLLRK